MLLLNVECMFPHCSSSPQQLKRTEGQWMPWISTEYVSEIPAPGGQRKSPFVHVSIQAHWTEEAAEAEAQTILSLNPQKHQGKN